MSRLQILMCWGMVLGNACQAEGPQLQSVPVLYTFTNPEMILESPQSFSRFLDRDVRLIAFQEENQAAAEPASVPRLPLPLITAPDEGTDQTVRGRVSNTKRNSTGTKELVEISVGSDDGIVTDNILDVRRDGKLIGQIKVLTTLPDSAISEVVEQTRRGTIQSGDDVSTAAQNYDGERLSNSAPIEAIEPEYPDTAQRVQPELLTQPLYGMGCGEGVGSGYGGYVPEFLTCACDETYDTMTWRAGGIFLKRADPRGQILFVNPGNPTQHIKAGDYNFGVNAGYEIGMIAHDFFQDNDGLEVRFFEIDDWTDRVARTFTGPVAQINTAPQVNILPGGPVLTGYSSRLLNAEINARRRIGSECEWVTVSSGFRYINLAERISGQLLAAGATTGTLRLDTENNLYGVQFGLDGTVWGNRRGCIEGYGRAGIYANESSANRIQSVAAASRARSTASPAFVGEIGAKAKYRLSENLSLYGRYQVLALDGVALASDQFKTLHTADSTLVYHGAAFGVEFVY